MDKYTKFASDGSADVVASANAYAEALTNWKAENELPTEIIESAVEAVFDRFPSQRLPMPSLIFEALQELNATPAQHKAISERVRAYVTSQCAKNTGRLDTQKGVGGGTMRLALPGQPIPARAAKKSA